MYHVCGSIISSNAFYSVQNVYMSIYVRLHSWSNIFISFLKLITPTHTKPSKPYNILKNRMLTRIFVCGPDDLDKSLVDRSNVADGPNVWQQAQSDIEWKFGLSKLIRNMHRTTTAPSPLNLVTTWFMYLLDMWRKRVSVDGNASNRWRTNDLNTHIRDRQKPTHQRKRRPSLVDMMGARPASPRSKAGAKWLSKVKKGQVAPKGLHYVVNAYELRIFRWFVFIIILWYLLHNIE